MTPIPPMAGYDTDTYGRIPTPFSVYDNDPFYGSVIEPNSGRTYQNFKPGRYPLPNDDAEQERMDLQHHMFRIALGGRLYLSPIKFETTKHVLDVGTGTGVWANQFAEEHPQTQVRGIDLSMIQPSRVPNCVFDRVDAEEEWMYYPLKFDFVFLRGMNFCFDNPKGVLRSAFLNMNSGAAIEYQALTWEICSDDGTTEGTHLERWMQLLQAGSKAMGRNVQCVWHVEEWLRELGFVDIRREHVLLPTQIDEFLPLVRGDMRNTNIHAYLPFHIIYAQKPSRVEMTRSGVVEPVRY
ncbi:Secondary metabolism regulator laeA [Apiospora saccharicola]|uniref:Secondary metabolism regulator laeA n=1 Tax=Apiospora saccharicola TaxID=335842 RepID=A0ABR1W1A3_9PEZI